MVGVGTIEAREPRAETRETERLALLAEASRLLADASLETPAVLERVCELVVPRLGSSCQVRLLSEDGAWLHNMASANADPAERATFERLAVVPQRADEGPPSMVLRTGQPRILTRQELEQFLHLVPSELQFLVQHIPLSSLLVLPLRARQRILGTLTILRGVGAPPFEPAEQLLLQELADRAGLALDVARAYEAERQARHAAEVAAARLARLQDVTGALSEAVTPADVARVIVEELIATLGADETFVVVPCTEDVSQLEVMGSRGTGSDLLAPLSRQPVGAPLPATVAYRTGTPVWVESQEALAAEYPSLPLPQRVKVQAMAALPLLARGQPLGAIGLVFHAPRAFSAEERALLQDLARQSAQALDRARLYEAEQRARTRAERVATRTARLQSVTAALSQVLTAAQVAEVVLDQGLAALGARAGGLWLMEGNGLRLLRSAGTNPLLDKGASSVPPALSLPLMDCLREGQPLWLESLEDLARRYPHLEEVMASLISGQNMPALACLPLKVEGRGVGVIAFGFSGAHAFDADERVFLALLAQHATQALERARLFEQERDAREALRQAHHTLEAIIQASPAAVMLLDADNEVRLWNPAAERIYGWRAEEVLGRPLPVVPGEKQEEFHAYMSRLAQGESLMGVEAQRHRRDGSPITVSIWATQVQDANGRPQFLSITADITERKRAAEAQRFLAEASTAMTILEYEVGLQLMARLAVPAYADGCYVYLVGDDKAVSCVATAYAEPRLALPRQLGVLPPGESAVSRVLESGQPELCLDHVPCPPTGERLRMPCELAAKSYLCVPLEVRGRIIGALSLVSSRRNYDEQDLTLVQELARRTSLAIDNARLFHEAQEAIRLREEFLSIASHELKTPTTTLQLHVHSLLNALASSPTGPSPERLRRSLETVDRQVKRQTQLVNELLDVSRLSSGRLELQPEPLDLGALAREVAERFEQELSRSGSHLTLRAEAPVHGCWDRMRLDQVVTNLVSNAVKYGRGNPIELTVQEGEGKARLIVRDRGIGIAPEHLARVFGRFERAVSERHYGGFGLGLWIVRQIVEAMGGHISVDSELGVGSTFTVELPCQRA